jgi:aryl-alcohol dehydrogenase
MACPAGSSLAIFGAGPVGLAGVMGAKIQGCSTIIAIEPMGARRELALSLGATHALDPLSGDVAGAIRQISPAGLDFVLETSGREEVVAIGLGALASHGVLGLVGVPPRPESALSVNLASLITFGHRIQGIIEGDSDLNTFIPQLLSYRADGRFPIDTLTTTFPFSAINEAIAAQSRGDCCKAVLVFE